MLYYGILLVLVGTLGAKPIKLFTAIIYGFLYYARVFVIRPSWKGLSGTNIPAYYENP
jgi:hypothetical protein